MSALLRVALRAVLWAGPWSIGLAIVLLVAARPWFQHGPTTPTAGDERAWNALWGAALLAVVGCVIGLVANVGWLAVRLSKKQRLTGREWSRTLANCLLGILVVVVWLGPAWRG